MNGNIPINIALPDEVLNDRSYFLEIIMRESFLFKCANDQLKNDKEIATVAVIRNSFNFRLGSYDLRNDRAFALLEVE